MHASLPSGIVPKPRTHFLSGHCDPTLRSRCSALEIAGVLALGLVLGLVPGRLSALDAPRPGIDGDSCAVGLAGPVPLAVEPRLKTLPLECVEILERDWLHGRELNRRYLASFDVDSLLWAFRKEAGLPTPGNPLGGWEAPTSEVRGHFVGHYLTATALLVRATGDTEIREKAEKLVQGLAECQAAKGDGYLSAWPPSLLDRLESRRNLPWAPLYTLHKILAGLVDQYRLCGNERALEAARGMAGYLARRFERFSDAELRSILTLTEEGGISEALWNLYAVSGDPGPRSLALKMEKRSFIEPLERGEDVLTGRHGNTHIPLLVASARRHELTGDAGSRQACEHFWDQVVLLRSYATGGSTNAEVWGPPGKLAGTLSNTNHETCKTYNMIRLTRHLLAWSADAKYGDFIERAMLNGILGTQEPAEGRLEYYVPQATGFKRVFGTPWTSFWCCTGTGVETWSRLQDSIYFRDAEGLWVNLYVSSRVRMEDGVALEQEARFPDDEKVSLRITVREPRRFALSLRIPGWVASRPECKVAGRELTAVELASARPGSWFRIEREWQDGDRVELRFPMALRTVAMPDDADLVAFAYGPVVLAGILGEGGDTATLVSANPAEAPPGIEVLPYIHFTRMSAGTSPTGGFDIEGFARSEGNRLAFSARGKPVTVRFVPFQRIVGERYGLYWPVAERGSEREARLALENEVRAFQRRAIPRDPPEAAPNSASKEAQAASRAAEAASTEAESAEAEHRRLVADPRLADARERLDLAFVAILARAGRTAQAAKVLEPYTVPFLRRDVELRVRAALGPSIAEVTGLRPLLVAADAWDGSHRIDTKASKPCVRTDLAEKKGHIYFALSPSSPLRGAGADTRIEVEYYSDGSPGKRFLIEYDSAPEPALGGKPPSEGQPYRATEAVEIPPKEGWHRSTLYAPRAAYQGRQNAGSDFRLNALGSGDLFVTDVRVSADPEWAKRIHGAFNALAKDALDQVAPTDPEGEKAHSLEAGTGTAGPHLGRAWRHASDAFGWTLQAPAGKVGAEAPLVLACVYWGSDVARTFDVVANGKVLATQELVGASPGVFILEEYPIPAEVAKGGEKVQVRFVARSGLAGGVFACALKARP